MAQTVKNLPAVQQTQVRSLGQEDPLEKEIASHSRILAWRIPWIDAEYIMRNTGPEEAQAGIKIAGRNMTHPTVLFSVCQSHWGAC